MCMFCLGTLPPHTIVRREVFGKSGLLLRASTTHAATCAVRAVAVITAA
jgi:hypothetical protein